MRVCALLTLSLAAALSPLDAETDAADFPRTVRPILAEHCGACHNPDKPRNHIDFLKAQTAQDIESRRGMWRNVAAQMRNRTMPPMASKLTEDDRVRISAWIDERLRETACALGDYAGPAVTRRLNRREYRNTVRDLLGVDYAVTDIFPADGTGGEGFDTNAETLFLPPILMERYLEAAQQILERVIVSPPLSRVVSSGRRLLAPGQPLTAKVSIWADGDYTVKVAADRPTEGPVKIALMVDGVKTGNLDFARYETKGGASRAATVKLAKGERTLTIQAESPLEIFTLSVDQRVADATPEKKALHYRLFRLEPGETPVDARSAARRIIAAMLPRAFRRPVAAAEIDRYLAMYDRVAQRNEPFEEAVKLALKAVLVAPDFLFHLSSSSSNQAGVRPLTQHEVAARLSYFLWSTMPDEELTNLAAQGKLTDRAVLAAQADRLLDDSRSRAFANAFIGQWLGTKDLGGRVQPTTSDVQDFYTPEVAVELREEPVVLFHHVLQANRPLTDLLSGNYTFLTERLVRFYGLEAHAPHVQGNRFQRVEWPDERRAGLLGLASVLSMTSNFQQTNPILRGAWVLENLLGTRVPSPPPDVPPLETGSKEKLTLRQKIEQHRANPTCAACHRLMDPIGFGLQNFDGYGRWRETDNGLPIDARGEMPSGETFNGPVELRRILVKRRADFVRTVAGKALGYALGRGLHDADSCTVERMVTALEVDGFKMRTLIREIVGSFPFGHSQGGVAVEAAPAVKKRERPPSFTK